MVSKLVADFPVPRARTSRFLQIADLGDHSPFELAAFFKIWQAMPPAATTTDRGDASSSRSGRSSVQICGEAENAPRDQAAGLRGDRVDYRNLRNSSASTSNGRCSFSPNMKKKPETLARAVRSCGEWRSTIISWRIRLQRSRRSGWKSSWRLFRRWLKNTFDPFPPDEARRRLTIVYRLVYPHPAEMKLTDRPAAAPAAPRPAPTLRVHQQARPAKPQAAPGPPPSEPRPRSWDESSATMKTSTGCGGLWPRPRAGGAGPSRTRWSARSSSRTGELVGVGHHERFGGPHAEVIALEHAGPSRGRRHALRDPRAVLPFRQDASLHRGDPRRGDRPGRRGDARPVPASQRPRPGEPSRRRGSPSRSAARPSRLATLNAPYLKRLFTGLPVRHRQVGHDPGRQDGRRARATADGSRQSCPAAWFTSCGAGWMRSSSESAPSLADDPLLTAPTARPAPSGAGRA